MGTICHQSKMQSLEIINSFGEGLEKNMMTNKHEVPDKGYAMRVYGVPSLSEDVSKILSFEMEARKINQQNLKGIQLPPFLIHRKQIYYQGEWKDKIPHGKGKVYFSEGHYYQGYFNEGQAECRDGILIFYDGSFYRGGFFNSQLSGKGKFISKSGLIYQGNWQNSKPEGLGKQIFDDGNEYQGEFSNGVKEGNGVFRWKDGKIYQGLFAKGKMNGIGKFYKGEKQYYEGQFQDNKKVGTGKLRTSFGQYTGAFENGEFSGKGKFQWDNNKIYEGGFKAGNFDGQGTITFSNGRSLKGVWKQGQNIELNQLNTSSSPKKKR